jgi:uncharacterized protein HemX
MPQTQPAPDAASAAPIATTASVGVPPAPSADDLARIASQAGGGSTGLLMAALAVLGGGGAAWKYLQSRQRAAAKKDELAHEQRMRELDLQADNQRRDDEKHGECKAARQALVGRIESLEGQGRLAEQTLSALRDRLDAVSAKADSAASMAERTPDLSKTAEKFDEAEEALASMSKRISRLETAAKAKNKGAK